MEISAAVIAQLKQQYGFEDLALEKALRSLHLIDAINQHKDLRGDFILYGGTALHMFYVPIHRLSVDLDLIYCGGDEPDALERTQDALEEVFRRFGTPIHKGLFTRREFMLWEVIYPVQSHAPYTPIDSIRIDMNFQPETLLYPRQWLPSHRLGAYQTRDVLIADPYDVAAGKLNALLGRTKTRDLYDVNLLSNSPDWDIRRVQNAFLASHAKKGVDVRTRISPKGLVVDKDDLRNNLLPLLKTGTCEDVPGSLNRYGENLLQNARLYWNKLLALTPEQHERLDAALHGWLKGEPFLGWE